ncbi:DUF1517 domain-containing protein [Gloeocapsa sp. PCC 73106]|uniref:DUF1517 domain-containing protein n=1 Tax=Gloeocapsa sp. PCC 73106 TaxID=102232 RepID=UPI0002AC9D18|nr:DUF1517 domain-containing protein [Gloeocapsa sp. PCC 73106]ELS00154.1 Protein of unknown function (DUF1517) [Gloeocapsa sp. PCC 73106]
MSSLGDRFNRLSGKTRYVVCRLFLHLRSQEAVPLLGILNQASRDAIAADGDLAVLGESLVNICENLLQLKLYWQSAANEGDVFWDEGDAGACVNELFTDSAQRYLSEVEIDDTEVGEDELLTLPVSQNLIVMITVAVEGEIPELETDLANLAAMEQGLKTLINLHYQDRYRAIQVHYSPAKLGDELTNDQLILNFPELIPL